MGSGIVKGHGIVPKKIIIKRKKKKFHFPVNYREPVRGFFICYCFYGLTILTNQDASCNGGEKKTNTTDENESR